MDTKSDLKSHVYLLGTNSISPVSTGATEGTLELIGGQDIVFTPESGGNQLVIALSKITKADFMQLFSGSVRFAITKTDSSKYTFSFDDMFTPINNLRRSFRFYRGDITKFEKALPGYVAWLNTLSQILPPEVIKRPNSNSFRNILVGIGIGVAILILLIVLFRWFMNSSI